MIKELYICNIYKESKGRQIRKEIWNIDCIIIMFFPFSFYLIQSRFQLIRNNDPHKKKTIHNRWFWRTKRPLATDLSISSNFVNIIKILRLIQNFLVFILEFLVVKCWQLKLHFNKLACFTRPNYNQWVRHSPSWRSTPTWATKGSVCRSTASTARCAGSSTPVGSSTRPRWTPTCMCAPRWQPLALKRSPRQVPAGARPEQ